MPAALLSLILIATSASYELTTLDEQTVRGQLVGLTAQSATIQNGDGEQEVLVEEMLFLAPVKPEKSETQGELLIDFADGSLIRATDYQAKSGRATITPTEGEPFEVSTRSVRSVRFFRQTEREQELWNEIVNSKPKGDAVVIRKGGDGKPVTLDFLEGALRDISDTTVQFDFEGDVIPVNRAKVQVAGLLYYQRDGARAPAAACRLDTSAGNRWMANEVRLVGESIEFTSAGDIKRTLPLGAISQFDFSLGKIAFLSDLAPVKKTWQPYLGSASVSPSTVALFDVRRDQNFAGEPIYLGEREFRKGLAIPSRSELSYRLPGEFSRFQALVGIDPSQKNRGHVRLEIRGDNRVLLDEAIAGDASALPLELDISGVGRLTILVDYGEGWDIGDQLLLGGARVTR